MYQEWAKNAPAESLNSTWDESLLAAELRALRIEEFDYRAAEAEARALLQALAAGNAADGEILLQRRPETGIWASLWTLPQADDDAATREWFRTHVEGDFASTEGLAPVAHAFSHYKLELQPLRVRPVALRARVGDNDDLRWVARDELNTLGIPAPIRRLLTGA